MLLSDAVKESAKRKKQIKDLSRPIRSQKRIERISGIATNRMQKERWDKALQLTANGLKREEMLTELDVTRETFTAYLLDPERAKAFKRAELAWFRRHWPTTDLEDMIVLICFGKTIKAAAEELGHSKEKISHFYRLMAQDPAFSAEITAARAAQAHAMADDMIDLGDKLGDADKKLSKEDVGMIRIACNNRQWLIARTLSDVYGDRKHLSTDKKITVDHTKTLDDGRKRAEEAKKKREAAVVHNSREKFITGRKSQALNEQAIEDAEAAMLKEQEKTSPTSNKVH
jgi:hypothetical protein